MKCSMAEENCNIKRSCIIGIFVNSRKDSSLNLLYDTTSRTCAKHGIKENHITVTEEPKDRYLTNYTPESKTKTTKPAKQCALELFEWLKNLDINQSLEMIGSDTTNDMFGWKGGMLQHVQQLLGRRLFKSFCCELSMSGHSVTLLLSLMDQHLWIKVGVVELVNFFLWLTLWNEILSLS